MTSLEQKLPATDIDALDADPDGGLWIGFRITGGISHLARNGVLTNYNATLGNGPKTVLKIIVRKDRSVWAIGDNKLLMLRGDHWEDFGKTHGLPNEPLWCLFFDSHGNIWASTRKKLFVMRSVHTTFELYPSVTFIVVDMAEMPNGQLWISDGWRAVRPLEPTSPDSSIKVPSYTRILIEPSGAMWMAQDYRGVSHFQPAANQDYSSTFVQETDVSAQQSNSIFRDHDGDIWVGTSRGLDRFQPSSLKALSNTRVEYYPALATDPQSGVWIGLLAHPLVHASGDSLSAVSREIGSSPMVCDDSGHVWLVDPLFNQLTEFDGGALNRFPMPEEVHHVPAQSIGLDYDGKLLVSFEEFGLWRFDGRWQQITGTTLPHGHPLSIDRDNARHVWLGYPDGRIVMRDEHGIHAFASGQGVDLGNVLTFAVTSSRVWAGGANGLAYLEQGVFRTVPLSRGTVLRGVSGIVEDKSHNLWLNTGTGIIRIDASQFGKLGHTSASLDYNILDDRQGVQGTAAQIKPTPSAVADKNGPLWFSTSGAVYSIDPSTVALRKTAPSMLLQSVTVNGTPVLDREHMPASISKSAAYLKELEIDYVGLDLPAPEKIVYQYLLEGEDKTWHEVGNRRQAFYTHLKPGEYRFHVRASDGASQWQELTMPLTIVITPAFYQTLWFYIFSALVALVLLYLLYLLRVHYVTSILKDRLKQRSDERMRIARALHDTLLQSVHGLMLRFHFAAQNLPENTAARRALEVALIRADAVYSETRSQVESLRDDVAEGTDLVSLIAKRAEELHIRQSMTFQIIENGPQQTLTAIAQSELYRIAGEALVNILLHSKSPSAEVVLSYGGSEFMMKCCDKGVGLPPDIVKSGKRVGHWGLLGMRERAASIEGKLQIWSLPNAGTEIEIRVPARRAYLHPTMRIVWLQKLIQFRRTATGLDSGLEIDSRESDSDWR